MDFSKLLQEQRQFFESGRTHSLHFRLTALSKLEQWIKSHEGDILSALKLDLNKAAFESYTTEIGLVRDEIHHTQKHLKQWVKPKRVRGNLKNWPSHGKIFSEPYGVVLIMAPWNYPFQLTLDPLIAALAAGNCVVLKPSNYSKATSKLIKQLCSEIFEPSHVFVIEGGREENTALLDQHFDSIFFTGSPAVGHLVMAAASKFLTPVTLELGGKSPCIVDETADIRLAAKRIVWGKFLNAGQTCVAPDYVWVHESIKSALIEQMIASIKQFYGDALINEAFPKIINEKHFIRLKGLLKNEKIIFGGFDDPVKNKISPTLLDEVLWHSPVMQEEIFGPILPIISYKSKEEIIKKMNTLPKPLATYLFTRSKASEKYFLNHLSFGGGCINDTVVHVASTSLPFGGVGNSGMGNYHGKRGFETFSHSKSILFKSKKWDVPLRYPPYHEKWLKILRKL